MAASIATTNGTTFQEVQDLTRSTAPTLATEGQSLKGLKSLTVVVEVATPASQTLSGGGNLRCYIYDGDMAKWSRLPAADLAVTATAVPRMAFESFDVIAPRNGRILWAADTVTTSAGTTCTVYQLGHSAELKDVYR